MGDKIDGVIFKSDLVAIGQFRCRPSYPYFSDTGPIEGYLLVFPRTSVRITHLGQAPIVADPNVVMFYNKGQRYRRDPLSERGDFCEWFAFAPQVIVNAMKSYDATVVERPDQPFVLSHSVSAPQVYFDQRQMVNWLITDSLVIDSLSADERALAILEQTVAYTYHCRGITPTSSSLTTQRSHLSLVREAQMILTTKFRENLSLADLASQLYTSPYHLSRLFRRYIGHTIHHYLNQIRLRTALERIEQGDTDLATLALDLGYSSHSHFTQVFRRTFGLAPSVLKRTLSTTQLQDLSKILIA